MVDIDWLHSSPRIRCAPHAQRVVPTTWLGASRTPPATDTHTSAGSPHIHTRSTLTPLHHTLITPVNMPFAHLSPCGAPDVFPPCIMQCPGGGGTGVDQNPLKAACHAPCVRTRLTYALGAGGRGSRSAGGVRRQRGLESGRCSCVCARDRRLVIA